MAINEHNIVDFNLKDFLGTALPCECGRVHRVGIEKVVIQKNALMIIPDILRDFDYDNVLLVADKNTYKVAGEGVETLLKDRGFAYRKLVYESDGDLVPDERAIGKMAVKIETDTQAIIAVGSGVLNDLAKYVGHKFNIPSIIVATAPSMDGYASDTSALILENLKTSCSVAPPKAIIGDIDILKNAPMVIGGIGRYAGEIQCPEGLETWESSVGGVLLQCSGQNRRDRLAKLCG